MYRVLRSLLFLLPAEWAHQLGMLSLQLLGMFAGLRRWLRARATRTEVDLSTTVAGLRFPSCVGLAAGLDKDAEAVEGLFALGFGAVEVGTLTPRPQPGNPAPRLFRIPSHRALINRMGFNNHGMAEAAARLRELDWRPGPVGVNVGKNKDTPLERATEDYLACVELLGPLADYVVINASSPNTPGLRTLQAPETLASLLRAVRAQVPAGKPLLLKIAPDLEPEAVDGIVDVAMAAGADGLIATNTTVARPFEHRHSGEAGGLSGKPVKDASTAVIRRAFERSGGKLPIIGVGGITTADDAWEKLRAGASLVQVYTGFVYEGPGMVPAILRGLSARLKAAGYASVSEVVGLDARGVPEATAR